MGRVEGGLPEVFALLGVTPMVFFSDLGILDRTLGDDPSGKFCEVGCQQMSPNGHNVWVFRDFLYENRCLLV